jgi:hypothetical protein
MFLRIYDPKNRTYSIVEFQTYVGDLPEDFGICEVVDEYASEKLVEDKLKLQETSEIDFSKKGFAGLNLYKKLDELQECCEKYKNQAKFWKQQSDKDLNRLNIQIQKLDECLTEKELLKDELEKLKAEAKAKVLDYSAQDDVEVLKMVIKALLKGDKDTALEILLEFV